MDNAIRETERMLKAQGIPVLYGMRESLTQVTLLLPMGTTTKTLRQIDAITKNYTTELSKTYLKLHMSV
jgi:hypothetical protein